MVDTRAFRPVEYDAKKVDLAAVVAPPFDVIDDKQTKALQKRSPFNVTHLTVSFGKDSKGKIKKGSKAAYAAVAKRLEEWLGQGVLVEASEPAVYAYEARYTRDGSERRMRGVVLLMRVDPDYRQVVPHERIFEKPVEERLALLTETGWDLEPIELLYSGERADATMWAYLDGSGRAPDLLATGTDGTQHLYWRVTDSAVVGTVVKALKGRKAYIADGHHRYATHVRYAKERRLLEYRAPRETPYDYKMCVLVNASDAGLAILPTHRVVLKSKVKQAEKILEAVAASFEVRPLDGESTVRERVEAAFAKADKPTLAVYLGAKAGLHLLTARAVPLAESMAPGRSFAWRSLDVAYLQLGVVRDALKVPEEKWGDDVRYTQDWEDAVRAVDSGKAVAALFHRPVTAKQLRAVADAGEMMPPKSTFFFPKLLSGVTFYRIGKDLAGPAHRRPTS